MRFGGYGSFPFQLGASVISYLKLIWRALLVSIGLTAAFDLTYVRNPKGGYTKILRRQLLAALNEVSKTKNLAGMLRD